MPEDSPKDPPPAARDGEPRITIGSLKPATIEVRPASQEEIDAMLIAYIYDLVPPPAPMPRPLPPLATDPDENAATQPLPRVSRPSSRDPER